MPDTPSGLAQAGLHIPACPGACRRRWEGTDQEDVNGEGAVAPLPPPFPSSRAGVGGGAGLRRRRRRRRLGCSLGEGTAGKGGTGPLREDWGAAEITGPDAGGGGGFLCTGGGGSRSGEYGPRGAQR